MDGLLFGLTDNAVLLLGAYTGIEVERFFTGKARLGAVVGAGIGNTISDALGAAVDPTMNGMIVGITLGCLLPLLTLPIIEKIKGTE